MHIQIGRELIAGINNSHLITIVRKKNSMQISTVARLECILTPTANE